MYIGGHVACYITLTLGNFDFMAQCAAGSNLIMCSGGWMYIIDTTTLLHYSACSSLRLLLLICCGTYPR